MRVADVMTTDLVTCPVDASLREAVAEMLDAAVGSTIVCDDGIPMGIVTETDVLAAGHDRDEPFSAIPVEAAMSSPLVTVTPEATVRKATGRMREEDVKKLVVVEDVDPVGIVTTEDVVHSYDALKAEVREQVSREKRQRDRW